MVRGQEEWLKEARRIKEQEKVREQRRRHMEYQEELEKKTYTIHPKVSYKTRNHLILVRKLRTKIIVRCWMTKESTFSWGSVRCE